MGEGSTGAAGQNIATHARANARGFRRALPYSAWHPAGLGAGPNRARPADTCLSEGDRPRPRRCVSRIASAAATSIAIIGSWHIPSISNAGELNDGVVLPRHPLGQPNADPYRPVEPGNPASSYAT